MNLFTIAVQHRQIMEILHPCSPCVFLRVSASNNLVIVSLSAAISNNWTKLEKTSTSGNKKVTNTVWSYSWIKCVRLKCGPILSRSYIIQNVLLIRRFYRNLPTSWDGILSSSILMGWSNWLTFFFFWRIFCHSSDFWYKDFLFSWSFSVSVILVAISSTNLPTKSSLVQKMCGISKFRWFPAAYVHFIRNSLTLHVFGQTSQYWGIEN